MTTIAIFDDNKQNLAVLHARVEQELPPGIRYTIVTATSLDELEAILEDDTQIDILITDIVMPEGQPSGIDVVQNLFPPESGTQVIYVSGYLNQALEVYRTKHLYFLLKPVDPAKLRDALSKAVSRISRRQPTMLRIKTGHKDQLVNIATVKYLESSLHKVTIHCRGRNVETYAKLGDIQEQLPASFSRCHRSFLVNLAFVSTLGEHELKLHDGTMIPISRRRTRQTQKDMLAYLAARAY